MDRKIRVLVVDDSMVFRTAISTNLSMDPELEIVATAADPYEARDKILAHKPDVLTLDVEMPGMNGLDFLRFLMPQYPMPVVVVSAVNGIVFEALRAGAVDFVAKPSGIGGMAMFVEDLASKVKIAVSAKLRPGAAPAAEITKQAPAAPPVRAAALAPGCSSLLVAIGASTGGTEATSSILKVLPANMPAMLITQHMPPGFTRMYAERLNRECAFAVKEAEHGDIVRAGHAYVAPGDLQMRVVKRQNQYVLQCMQGEKVSGHRPSVNVLFDSVADAAGDNAVGIILTGMGADGATGLLKMREKGAFTIGQDQKSCVVYGMPMEAYKMGGVVRQAALDVIPAILLNHLKGCLSR